MGEVDAVIPEKSSSDSSETTTSNSVINGEINGICKTNEVMEIDTEDDSQVSSGNSVTATETESDITTKKNKLINKTESSNSNSSSNSDNSNSCSSSGSTNLKQNLTASLSSSNSQSAADNKVNEISSAVEISDDNSQKSTKTNFNEKDSSSSKENGQDCQIDNEKIKDNEKQKDKDKEKIKENEKEDDKCESAEVEEKNSDVEDEKNVSNSKNDSSNKMEVDCSSSPEKSTAASNNSKKETPEKQSEKLSTTATNNSENDDEKEKEKTKSQSKIENSIQLEKSEKKLAQIEDAPVPMEVDSKSNKDDSSNKTTTATDTTAAAAPPPVEEKKCIEEDDGAVIIPSDSESDNQDSNTTDSKTKTSTTTKEPIKEKDESKNIKDTEKVIDDDVVEVLSDKDDCVVIEDDDKKDNNSVRRTSRQRKGGSKGRDYSTFDDDDVTEIVDDSQPPSKRPRTSDQSGLSAPIGQIGQITIRDARTLMASPFQDNASKQNFNQFSPQKTVLPSPALVQNSVSAKPNTTPYTVIPGGMPPEGVFPVNIRPALAIGSSIPPKLVPATITPTVQNSLIPESPVLPNLTDDMFVLEAPSFIVPYIYEKPPTDNLKEIVAKLANEIKESEKEKEKEDKNDEKKGQSMDEDKKDDDSSSEAKKEKRKKKKRKNPDDSWGESDESTDEDASDAETRTKILIKEVKSDLTSIVTNPEALKQLIMGNSEGDKKSENYFDSPLGKFFIDIGIGLVQEYVQTDLLRQQKRKRDKARGHNTTEFEKAINSLKQNLQTSKKRNEPFKFEMRRCEYCNFKSESALVMANHYETPHMRQAMYKCNFCSFEVKPPHDILFHMEAVHNIKGRLDKAPSYHQCPNCPFEDNGKSKLARHLPVCSKKFRPEHNLLPPSDWEAPAKIPRIKPRHGLVGTATAYQAMAAQAAAQKAALAQLSQRAVAPTNNTNNAYMRNRGRPQQPTNPPIRPPVPVTVPQAANIRGVRQAQPGIVMPNVHMTGTQFIQQQNTKKPGNSGSGGQPSISITPLPRQPNNQSQNAIPNPLSLQTSTISPISSVQSKPMSTVLKPGQGPSGSKASFVICEICDGYIKDLEQLRNHMQWMHKVKIHPKMIYNRPPLNCQKCQFRFFTDQGLERHLLGSHGLVTSSMQEAANKGKDAGRCPVCGRMYQWKLLNHVSRDHHMTLKPAHLSYKCTVCTATFGMYKQFENHVYTAHSTVAKKAMDNKKNSSSSSSGGNVSGNMSSIGNNSSNSIMNSSGSTTIQRSSGGSSSTSLSLGGANDSLLKPLKINDEITIIPQPAAKSRGGMVNEMESHVIDLSLSSSSKYTKSNTTTNTTTTSSLSSSATTTTTTTSSNNSNNNNNQLKNNSNSSGYLMNHGSNNRNFNNNNNYNNDDIQEISDDDDIDEEDNDNEDSDPIALSNGTKST